MSDTPVLCVGSTRGTIMLWVTTDPPGTWTESLLVAELEAMDIAEQTVLSAIAALRARGLLAPGQGNRGLPLKATGAGFRSVRAHFFGGRVMPAKDFDHSTMVGPGPWCWVQGEGWVREDVYEARQTEGSG